MKSERNKWLQEKETENTLYAVNDMGGGGSGWFMSIHEITSNG